MVSAFFKEKVRKISCDQCMRGHRSTPCTHSDRVLVEVRDAGRPPSKCHHKPGTCPTFCVAYVEPPEPYIVVPAHLNDFKVEIRVSTARQEPREPKSSRRRSPRANGNRRSGGRASGRSSAASSAASSAQSSPESTHSNSPEQTGPMDQLETTQNIETTEHMEMTELTETTDFSNARQYVNPEQSMGVADDLIPMDPLFLDQLRTAIENGDMLSDTTSEVISPFHQSDESMMTVPQFVVPAEVMCCTPSENREQVPGSNGQQFFTYNCSASSVCGVAPGLCLCGDNCMCDGCLTHSGHNGRNMAANTIPGFEVSEDDAIQM